jgi:hypothetical protein
VTPSTVQSGTSITDRSFAPAASGQATCSAIATMPSQVPSFFIPLP